MPTTMLTLQCSSLDVAGCNSGFSGVPLPFLSSQFSAPKEQGHRASTIHDCQRHVSLASIRLIPLYSLTDYRSM